jgi:hypothetical protein
MLNNNIINLLKNKLKTPNLSNLLKERVEQIENDTEIKSYIKLSPLEFNFNNSHFIFINKDIAYLLNENNLLYKIYRTEDVKNKYSIVEKNNNFVKSDSNSTLSLITLDKEYLFGFDSNEFGKGENVIKLLLQEHHSSNKKIQIKMDEISQKILTKSIEKSNEVVNDIYLNLFNFETKEKEQFLKLYIPNSENNNSLISITQNNSSLYILHPIYKKQISKNKQQENIQINSFFFSGNYIYILDEFELSMSHNSIKEDDESFLNINHKYSYIIKTSNDNLQTPPKRKSNKCLEIMKRKKEKFLKVME